mgnify:CR=1 FL=1
MVVDDVGDVLDVDATRGDIRGDQDIDVAMAEGAQRLLARTLTEVAVDGRSGEPALDQVVSDPSRSPLGPREDQHLSLIHI